MKPICEGHLAILRPEHFILTIVAFWMGNDWISNWNIYSWKNIIWLHFICNEISLLVFLFSGIERLCFHTLKGLKPPTKDIFWEKSSFLLSQSKITVSSFKPVNFGSPYYTVNLFSNIIKPWLPFTINENNFLCHK
jgi:hypothetical protein